MINQNNSLLVKLEKYLKNVLSHEDSFSSARDFLPYVSRAISQSDIFRKSASRFGTPQYILDTDFTVARAESLLQAFRRYNENVKVFYAFKSNDLPFLIKILRDTGIHADVASGFELRLALDLAFQRIIFTAPIKTLEEISLWAAHSDKIVLNVDNFDELENIMHFIQGKQLRFPLELSFRIVPDEILMQSWSKFGFTLHELRHAVNIIMKIPDKFCWSGIHFHSSWNTSPVIYLRYIELIGNYLASNFTSAELATLRFIDFGGGFVPEGQATLFFATEKGELLKKISNPEEIGQLQTVSCIEKVSGIEDFACSLCKAAKEYILNPLSMPELEIWIEPGRYLSSQGTHILLEVVSMKRGNIIVNGGINLVGAPSFDYIHVPVVNISRPSTVVQRAKIYGHLCDPDDHWGYSYFGEPCRKGDILAVMNQGAYKFSTSWRWQRPVAPYIAFSGDTLIQVKRTESYEDRYGGCLI